MKKTIAMFLLLLVVVPSVLAFTPTLRVKANGNERVETFNIGNGKLTDVSLTTSNLELKSFGNAKNAGTISSAVDGTPIDRSNRGRVTINTRISGTNDEGNKVTYQFKGSNLKGDGELTPLVGGEVFIKKLNVCKSVTGEGKHCEKKNVVISIDFEDKTYTLATIDGETDSMNVKGRI